MLEFVSTALDLQKDLSNEESAKRFRQLAELLPQLIWVADPDGTCEFLSRQWYEYTGITEEKRLKRTTWSKAIHPDDHDQALNAWRDAVAGVAPYDIEFRIRRFDGVYRWFKTRAVPTLDDHGHVIKWYGSCTDIDDQKRIEQLLKDEDQKKDNFIAVLAHELRNPLAAVKGALQLFPLLNPSDARRHEVEESISRQVDHLIRLIDDLLEISRIKRGQIQLQLNVIDCRDVVKSACDTVSHAMAQRRHHLEFSVPKSPVWINADPHRLEQVLVNLLANSIKYTEPGGQITIQLQVHHTSVAVSIRDNGRGIHPLALKSIFEPFTRSNRSLCSDDRGLGLGLTVAKQLIEMHGGGISAVSEGMGKGSEFTCTLPLAEPPRHHKANTLPDDVIANLSADACRVLIVEDMADIARNLEMLMAVSGFDPIIAANGQKALELAAADCPQVILLDVGLPDMDGYEVAQRIRASLSSNDKQPIIIGISGYGQEDDRIRALKAGFNEHFRKPVDYRVLLKAIQKHRSAR